MRKQIITVLLLLLISFFALSLRILYLPNNMFFGYEQGRDAIVARDIIQNHEFTLLGPQTDIQGIYHGVGYYYILTLLYLLTQGDPGQTIVIFAAINALTCIIVFFLTKEIIGKTRYAILAALMTACSFDLILYGRWLSNVSFSIPLLALFFYSLTKLVKTKNPVYWLLVVPISGILSHFELLHMLYAIIAIPIAIKLFSLPVKNKQFVISIFLFILVNISFLLFDVRHDFLVTNAVIHYLTSQPLSQDPLAILAMYGTGLIETMVNGLFPSNGTLIFLFLTLLTIFYLAGKREHVQSFKLILLFIFFSAPYIFLLKFGSLEHFYAGTTIAWIVYFNFLVFTSEKKFAPYVLFGIYGLLLIGNSFYIYKNLAERNNIFYHTVQNEYRYQDQLATMDYIFSQSKEGFTLESLNIPYLHQHAWQYLYEWYGKKNYPEQYARNAHGDNPKLFIIIEPGISEKAKKKLLKPYVATSTLVKTVRVGAIEIQERQKRQ